MARVKLKGDYLTFECPGCGLTKRFRVRGEGSDPKWEWNGDADKPTVKPSLHSRWDEGEEHTPKCCHLIMTDGKIEFCGDSTHALAGQTVEMKEIA